MITYAGFQLGFPDSDGEIQRWFDDFVPLSDSRMILEWPSAQTNFGPSPYYVGQALPMPNWSRPPRPKLNSWYRPVGASRWAFGFFLADYLTLQKITSAIGTSNAAQTLVMESPSGFKRSWQGCYLLPPHPVSHRVDIPTGLWVLPIVDERWYWQFGTGFQTPIDATAATAKTWQQQMQDVAAGIGIGLTVDQVPTAYLYPDKFFISGTTWHNGAILLDALAYSVGQRILPAYGAYGPNTTFAGGNWSSTGWAGSRSIRTSNLTIKYDAGALQSGVIQSFPQGAAQAPFAVRTVFRIYKNGITVGDWKYQRYVSVVNANAAGYTGATSPTYGVTILSTALANISTGNSPTQPDNQGALDAMALQIAADYYASLWIQDSVVIGISQWQESGFDDYVEFTMTNDIEKGVIAKTRIHSAPYNQVFERMLHYDPSTWEFGERIYGTLDGPLAALGTQTITLGGTDGAKPSGTTHILVTDVLNGTANTGDMIEASRFGDKWVVNAAISGALPGPGNWTGVNAVYTGSTSATVLAGATGTFLLDAASGGNIVTALVDKGICFPSPGLYSTEVPYQLGKFPDGTYQVLDPTTQFSVSGSTQVDALSGTAAGATGTYTIWSVSSDGTLSIGTTITAYILRGTTVPHRFYLCRVTNDNKYEIVDSDGLMTGYASSSQTSYIGSQPSGGSTTVAMVVPIITANDGTSPATVNVVLARGLVKRSNYYLIGAAGQTGNAVTNVNSGLHVLNPAMIVEGTTNALVAAGATVNVTTNTPDSLVITGVTNRLSVTVNNGKTVTLCYVETANAWNIIACHNP